MIKKNILLMIIIILLLAGMSVNSAQVRVSYLFVHYSVGESAITNCWGPSGDIRKSIDGLTVTVGTDTARIVLRTHNINYDHLDSALSDTVAIWSPSNSCWGDDRINSGYDYDFQSYSINRNRIYNSDGTSPLLQNLFNKPNKEDSAFWIPFTEHTINYGGGQTAWEHYDMVIIKNPYLIWKTFTQQKADQIKGYYEAVRDSIINHPEISIALAMGSPLAYQTGSDDDFSSDTSMAKIVYNLGSWFASDSFFTHDNNGTYKNIWKLDSYRPMCELDNVYDKYCLDQAYWAGSGSQSHLSAAGMEKFQNVLVDFIRLTAQDILIQKSGTVTRLDIDRKIKEFREGNATEQDVLNLIQQYNGN